MNAEIKNKIIAIVEKNKHVLGHNSLGVSLNGDNIYTLDHSPGYACLIGVLLLGTEPLIYKAERMQVAENLELSLENIKAMEYGYEGWNNYARFEEYYQFGKYLREIYCPIKGYFGEMRYL